MRGESFSSLLSDGVFFLLFFSFSPRCFASLRLPPPRLSVACTGGPRGSSSQPVSWSHPPEQHMTFHDYCYCLCPSSRRLQAETQKKRGGSGAGKLREWAARLTSLPLS